MINARSIAVSGVGFGALAMVGLGLLIVDPASPAPPVSHGSGGGNVSYKQSTTHRRAQDDAARIRRNNDALLVILL